MALGQFPVYTPECDALANSVTWESSDPTVASVTPTTGRGAFALTLHAGSTNVTARFVVNGSQTSTFLQIVVR